MRYHIAMRPFEHLVLRLIVRLADGPGSKLMLLGLRLWLGAFLLRKGVTTLFLLYKLVRRQMTSVLSVGTGASKSVARRDAWRMTVPVREVGLAPLYAIQYGCYAVETAGSVVLSTGLLINAVTSHQEGLVSHLQRAVISVLTLRPFRLALTNPTEFFIIYPLVYAWLRYQSVKKLSTAKVVVTNIINNNYGTKTEVKTKTFDPLLIAHLALEATGLPWLAQMFIVYRNCFFENGPRATYSAFRDHLRGWFRSESWVYAVMMGVLNVLTRPLLMSAVLLAGTKRPTVAPVVNFHSAGYLGTTEHSVPVPDAGGNMHHVVTPPSAPPGPTESSLNQLPVVEVGEPDVAEPAERPGLGLGPPPQAPSNALVQIHTFPHDVGLELFRRGEALLIGGDALPTIAVVTDPRLRVIIPMKPVTNNTFAWDMLTMLGSHPVADRLRVLTKVPANPFRAAVEVQKFITKHLDIDLDDIGRAHPDMTERDFLLQGLRLAYCVNGADHVDVPHLTIDAVVDDYLNAETKKHHPGWTTRAFGGQTKFAAWPYSIGRAARMWPSLLLGESHTLVAHTWLSLPVVKKQAERKEFDEVYRCRGAVIPEQELQLIWTHVLKPLSRFLEEKSGSWAPKFELFHGHLVKVWQKFAVLRDVVYSEEDMSDHGATLEWVIAQVIAQFCGSLVRVDRGHTIQLFTVLFREMIFANVGVPDTEGFVHIMKTSRGMKDGVWGTSFIGGIYKIIGELHKLWVAWNNNRAVRDAYPNVFQLISACVEEVHGDNAVAAYPTPAAPFMCGAYPEVARVVARIGLVVKPSESAIHNRLEEITCMSWHLANIGSITHPRIVGWKSTAESLKSFFLPERIADFDHLGDTTREYLGQILVCIYILGYWNGETRIFCEHAWSLLWRDDEEERMLQFDYVADLSQKVGADIRLSPVSTRSARPYPPVDIVKLWLGPSAPERLCWVTAPGAPTTTDGARMMLPVSRLREDAAVPFRLGTEEVSAFPDPAAGVWAGPAAPRPGLPGGSPTLRRIIYRAFNPPDRGWADFFVELLWDVTLRPSLQMVLRRLVWFAFESSPRWAAAFAHHLPSMFREFLGLGE